MFPEMLLLIRLLSAWTQKCMNCMCEWSHHVLNDNGYQATQTLGCDCNTANPQLLCRSVSKTSSGSQGPVFLFSLLREFCLLIVSNGL